jgi:hypothetical protein
MADELDPKIKERYLAELKALEEMFPGVQAGKTYAPTELYSQEKILGKRGGRKVGVRRKIRRDFRDEYYYDPRSGEPRRGGPERQEAFTDMLSQLASQKAGLRGQARTSAIAGQQAKGRLGFAPTGDPNLDQMIFSRQQAEETHARRQPDVEREMVLRERLQAMREEYQKAQLGEIAKQRQADTEAKRKLMELGPEMALGMQDVYGQGAWQMMKNIVQGADPKTAMLGLQDMMAQASRRREESYQFDVQQRMQAFETQRKVIDQIRDFDIGELQGVRDMTTKAQELISDAVSLDLVKRVEAGIGFMDKDQTGEGAEVSFLRSFEEAFKNANEAYSITRRTLGRLGVSDEEIGQMPGAGTMLLALERANQYIMNNGLDENGRPMDPKMLWTQLRLGISSFQQFLRQLDKGTTDRMGAVSRSAMDQWQQPER